MRSGKCLGCIVLAALLLSIGCTCGAAIVPAAATPASGRASLRDHRTVIPKVRAAQEHQAESDRDATSSAIRLAGPKDSGGYCSP